MRDDALVKTTRNALGLSQTALAEELGVSPAAVCRWESGERGVSRPIKKLLEQLKKRVRA